MLEIDNVYCGDSLEIMKQIPDKSVDLLLTDMPYNMTACEWDKKPIDLDALWVQLKRIGKDNCAYVFTASQPFTTDLINSNRKCFRYCWYWDKHLPTGFQIAKAVPMRQVEDILVFGNNINYSPIMKERDLPVWKKQYSASDVSPLQTCDFKPRLYTHKYPTNLISASNADNQSKQHPTQKPVALMEYLIKTYTNEGDLVLDPFLGSGTTAVACINTNRHYIGMELSQTYVDIANKRIDEARRDKAEKDRQIVLF